MTRSSPPWYTPESVGKSIRNAREVGESKERIVSLLGSTAFEGVPEERIEAVLDATVERERRQSLPLSQQPSVDATPRDLAARRLDLDDLRYLSEREFARVVGLVVEQFDGNTVRPAANESVVPDLYWNRQHATVGLRTLTATGKQVGIDHVKELVEGDTASSATRPPSKLAIVTNGGFTDEAIEYSEEHDIHLLDGGHLETWLRRTKPSFEAVGTVLEEGEGHEGPLNELGYVPPIPAPRKLNSPLEVDRAFDIDTGAELKPPDETPTVVSEESGEPGGEETGPVDPSLDDEKPPGEKGKLYADPDEDGDYDAFDTFVEEM